jgi:hypothetical protein
MFRPVNVLKTTIRLGVLVLFALLAPALLVPSAATAQSPREMARKLEAIRERMEKGQGLYVAGKYSEAVKVFEAGYKEYPYSAFLFNAGVCYQKLNDVPGALAKYRAYVQVDPDAPDVAAVKQRIAALEGVAVAPPPAVDGGLEGGAAEAGVAPPPVLPGDASMKSLVVVETDPEGAPLHLYAKSDASAGVFKVGGENRGWTDLGTRPAPANLTLDVGTYHLVVEKFRDFNFSETDIEVKAGHVYHFKANLSQGAFMAFLRVSANVRGAHVYLDDKDKKKPEWGQTPHGELVPAGTHSLRVDAPGFQTLIRDVVVNQGEQKELEVRLERVNFGLLRIDSNAPEIKVRIDDAPVGFWRSGEPPLEVKVDAGKHRLTVTSSGRKTLDGTIDVPRGQVLPVHARLIPTYPRGAAWTQAIIGAAFIGAAIYFGVESNNVHDELENDRKTGVLEQEDSRVVKGRWFAVGANAGFVIGGALGVLAVYNFIKDPLPESTSQSDKPAEFDDPLKAPPTARRSGGSRHAKRLPARPPTSPVLGIAPSFGSNGGGLSLGGSF